MEQEMFFSGWAPLLRIVVVGVLYYFALIVLLRAAGKRTLSRMNAYDLVITMGIGSILAKALLNKEVSLMESLVATGLLVGLQYAMSVAMCHFNWVRKLVTGEPALLFHRGEFLKGAMRRERVTQTEIQAIIESKGIPDKAMVETVILASSGELNVVLRPECVTAASLTAGAKPHTNL